MSIQLTVTKMYGINSDRNEVAYGSDTDRCSVSVEFAVLWFLDMFVRYQHNYGVAFTVHDVSENFVDISSTGFHLPQGIKEHLVRYENLEELLGVAPDAPQEHVVEPFGYSYELSGTHDELAKLKDMVLICIRSIAGNYPELTSELIDKIAVQLMRREVMMA